MHTFDHIVEISLTLTKIDGANPPQIDRLVKLWSEEAANKLLISKASKRNQFYCDLWLCSEASSKLNKYPLIFNIVFPLFKNWKPLRIFIFHQYLSWFHPASATIDSTFTVAWAIIFYEIVFCLLPQTWCVFLCYCEWK